MLRVAFDVDVPQWGETIFDSAFLFEYTCILKGTFIFVGIKIEEISDILTYREVEDSQDLMFDEITTPEWHITSSLACLPHPATVCSP